MIHAKSYSKQKYPVTDYFRVIFMGIIILLTAILVKIFGLMPNYRDTDTGVDNREHSYSGISNDRDMNNVRSVSLRK